MRLLVIARREFAGRQMSAYDCATTRVEVEPRNWWGWISGGGHVTLGAPTGRFGFFVTERRAALRRSGRMKNRAVVVPVIVDDLSTERVKDDELARDFLDAAQLVRAPGGRPSAADLQAIARLLAERRG